MSDIGKSQAPRKERVVICTNFRPFSGEPSCAYRGSKKLLGFLKAEIKKRGLDVELKASVCLGRCSRGPNVRRIGEDFIHEATEEKLLALLARIEAGEQNES